MLSDIALGAFRERKSKPQYFSTKHMRHNRHVLSATSLAGKSVPARIRTDGAAMEVQ
jgi:hypothetical protein